LNTSSQSAMGATNAPITRALNMIPTQRRSEGGRTRTGAGAALDTSAGSFAPASADFDVVAGAEFAAGAGANALPAAERRAMLLLVHV
jgi:hypothetical protein